jgi:hypothetical protein
MEKIACFISFLIASSCYVVNLSIPLYLISKFSASPFILGISGFFGNFSYTTFTYIFHKLRWKLHFPWFIISSFLISLIYFLLPFPKDYKYLFIMFFVNGIFYSRFWPSIQYVFSQNSLHIDKFNISWSSGVILGIFISGYLFKIKNILPFLAGGVFAFIAFSSGAINFKKFKLFYKNLPEKFYEKKHLDKETKKAMILNFTNFFAIGGLLFIFPKLANSIGYSSTLISNIITSLFLVRAIMFYIFSRIKISINDKIFFIIYLFICLSLLAIGFLKSPVLHTIFISFLGVCSAYSYRLGIFTVIEKRFSTELNESIIGIGLFTGPLIIGILSQIFGIFNGFILSGVLILIIFIFQVIFLK